MNFITEFENQEEVERDISSCQRRDHIQQVAFSTYHHALTQICFDCRHIRTSIKKEDVNVLEGEKDD